MLLIDRLHPSSLAAALGRDVQRKRNENDASLDRSRSQEERRRRQFRFRYRIIDNALTLKVMNGSFVLLIVEQRLLLTAWRRGVVGFRFRLCLWLLFRRRALG